MALGKCKRIGCFNDAISADGYCLEDSQRKLVASYSTGNRIPKKLEPLPHGLISLEIETDIGRTPNGDRGLLALVHSPACEDGSISGVEYKVSKKCCGTHRVGYHAASICERAAALGARVNNRCGLHAHIDVRGLDHARVRKFLAWCYMNEEEWSKFCPPRRWGSTYVQRAADACVVSSLCSLLNDPERIRLNYWPGFSTQHSSWVHYCGYGNREKQTVEFRWHPGSLSPIKVSAYCDFLAHLGHYLRDPLREFPARVLDLAPPDSLGYEYMQARAASGGILRAGTREQAREEEAEPTERY